MLSAKRKSVTMRRMEGKAENSIGRRTCSPTSKMITDSVILKANKRSSKNLGSGRIINMMTPTTPSERRMSGCLMNDAGDNSLISDAMRLLPFTV